MINRRGFMVGASVAICSPVSAWAKADMSSTVVLGWYRLALALVRHTSTYSPPVAARTFAFLGIGAWETLAVAEGRRSLSGQLNGYAAGPAPQQHLHLASALHGALSTGVGRFFDNTGPSGQQAMRVTERRIRESIADFDPASAQAGADIMGAVIAWSLDDGGAVVRNLGFADSADVPLSPQDWTPTSSARIQQAPLLPDWGDNRPMVMKRPDDFLPPPPLAYSTDPASAFYADAMEVYTVSKSLTEEQRLIARFWSDDPMLTPTPPGHWISILLGIAERDGLAPDLLCDALARVGISQNDAFIACWRAKYRYNLLRPVTYIRANIDPDWQPLLITPPFPEYPSGHSCQSAAAAEVLTGCLGENFAFEDETHVREGLPVRKFPSFRVAAEEAAMSRLYGGIHFRYANEQGIAQGIQVGAAVMTLETT